MQTTTRLPHLTFPHLPSLPRNCHTDHNDAAMFTPQPAILHSILFPLPSITTAPLFPHYIHKHTIFSSQTSSSPPLFYYRSLLIRRHAFLCRGTRFSRWYRRCCADAQCNNQATECCVQDHFASRGECNVRTLTNAASFRYPIPVPVPFRRIRIRSARALLASPIGAHTRTGEHHRTGQTSPVKT